MTERTQGFFAITLWYKPARTMQGLIEADRGHGWALASAALFGAVQSWRFYKVSEESSALVFLLGAVIGVAGLYFFGWLLRNFSRWFRAASSLRAVRTALGLSLVPWTLAFAGLSWLSGNAADASEIAGYFPVFFAVFIYGYIILLISVAAVLNIGVLKTFLCLVLTTLVSFFPITLVLQLMMGGPPSP